MAKSRYRTKNKEGGGWKIALAVVLIIAILTAVAFLIYYFFGDEIKKGLGVGKEPLAVTIDGKTYVEDASGLSIASGVHIKIDNAEEETYIQILRPEADFSVTLDGKETPWNALPMDFSMGFSAQRTEDGFILSFPNLQYIVQMVMQAQSVTVGERKAGDIFTMLITSGDKSRRLSFDIIEISIDVDPPNIIY